MKSDWLHNRMRFRKINGELRSTSDPVTEEGVWTSGALLLFFFFSCTAVYFLFKYSTKEYNDMDKKENSANIWYSFGGKLNFWRPS